MKDSFHNSTYLTIFSVYEELVREVEFSIMRDTYNIKFVFHKFLWPPYMFCATCMTLSVKWKSRSKTTKITVLFNLFYFI